MTNDRDDELDPVRQVHAEPVAAGEATGDQRHRHPIGAPRDLAEGERLDPVGRVVIERRQIAPPDERAVEEVAELRGAGW